MEGGQAGWCREYLNHEEDNIPEEVDPKAMTTKYQPRRLWPHADDGLHKKGQPGT
jgi:hypothetical protein